jgi:hypothetical protein
MSLLWVLLTSLLLSLVLPAGASAVTKNGFDLSNSTLASKDIKRGGPEKDGIFALTFPEFIDAKESPLSGSERVLGGRHQQHLSSVPSSLLKHSRGG